MRVLFLTLASMVLCMNIVAQNQLSGKVIDHNQQPISEAVVTISELNKTTVTDQDGNYSISNLPSKSITVSVFKLGYFTYEKFINLSTGNIKEDFIIEENLTNLEEVIVSAVRAQYNSPTTFTLISKQEIKSVNMGQDAPYLLAMEPSVVVTSDAGTGIGYTDLRLRGSDTRKINVTINGVPLNDPESHGVFWVDIPDVASSVQSIQIQRGVGTSTNGSGAFGGSINLQTDYVSPIAFAEYSGSTGSFNTWKNSVHFGTGLLKNHWFLEGKVGKMASDGYRDRAWSDLKSYFLQTGYHSEKTIVKLVSFGGLEETYQAWYAVSQEDMDKFGRTYNPAGLYFTDEGDSAFYDNMKDHYQQDHLQLHFIHKFNDNLQFNAAAHYTYGRGYYQDYAPGYYAPLQILGLRNFLQDNSIDTIKESDYIHRLWLKNNFYGGVFGLTYTKEKYTFIWGGAINNYAPAKHYGELLWVRNYPYDLTGGHYYDNEAKKLDWNTYMKFNYEFFEKLNVFVDFQFRRITYEAWGIDKEYENKDTIVDISRTFNFFNPKAGIFYKLNSQINLFASLAVANREPNRKDFLKSNLGETIKNETLYDIELGLRYNTKDFYFEAIIYNMIYKNQLVLTGELSSVGSPLRKNVGNSFRRGIELSAGINPFQFLKAEGNISISANKTDLVVEDTANTVKTFKNMDISYSPSVLAGGKITLIPFKNLEATFYGKYVSDQYLDNTQSSDKMLEAYKIFDFNLSYKFKIFNIAEASISGKIINLSNEKYSSNGIIDWDGSAKYYPQAGRNFLVGLNIKF